MLWEQVSRTVPRACALATPGGCVAKMRGGDDCVIHGGTYRRACPSGTNWSTAAYDFSGKNGTASDYTVVKGYPGEIATLCVGTDACQANPGCSTVGVFSSTSYVKFENLHVQGALRIGTSGTLWGTHHVSITGNDLSGGAICDGNFAMLRIEESQAVQVDHNLIHNISAGNCTGNGHWSGIKLYGGQDTVIEYNTIERGTGDLMTHVIDNKDCPMGTTIRYNRFKDGVYRHAAQCYHCRSGVNPENLSIYGNVWSLDPSLSYGVLHLINNTCSGCSTILTGFDIHHNPFDNIGPSWNPGSEPAPAAIRNYRFVDNAFRAGGGNDCGGGDCNHFVSGSVWGDRTGWELDYNRYDSASNYVSCGYGGSSCTAQTHTALTGWQGATGKEGHSGEASPGCSFVDTTSYKIPTGTACKTASSTGGEVGAYGATDCVGHTCGQGTCGNGIVETGEQCDGGNLGGQTCVTLGYSSGTLSCTSACAFDTSGCTITPPPTVEGLERDDTR